MQKQYSYEIICIHIELPQNFLLTFLDAKTSMMVSISSSNNCFSMINVSNPFNLWIFWISISWFLHISNHLLRNLWRAPLCYCIKTSIRVFFFLLSLSEAYFVDDMAPLKFRETISQRLNNLQIWNSKWCPCGYVKSESMINLYLSGRQYMVREYSLCPLLSVIFGFRATSLTRFVENMCNICISK